MEQKRGFWQRASRGQPQEQGPSLLVVHAHAWGMQLHASAAVPPMRVAPEQPCYR